MSTQRDGYEPPVTRAGVLMKRAYGKAMRVVKRATAPYWRHRLALCRADAPGNAIDEVRSAGGRGPRPFMIVFAGRTGSTMLVDRLARHPAVIARGEELKGRVYLLGARAQLRRVRRIFDGPHPLGAEATGLKANLGDIRDPLALARLLRRRGARVIRMTRRNAVKQVVSFMRARQLWLETGRWHLSRREDRIAPMRIEPRLLAGALRERAVVEARIARYVSELGLPLLELTYEELLLDVDATLERTFRFLGVPPRETTTRLLKHTPDDLRRTIINFDEVRAHLEGTPYAAMLEEVLVPC